MKSRLSTITTALVVVGVLVHSGSAEDARGWVPRFAPEYPIWIHEDVSLGDFEISRRAMTELGLAAETTL